MSLCRACRRALHGKPVYAAAVELNQPRIHHHTIFAFLAAADEKCYICSAVERSLTVTCRVLLRELAGLIQSERGDLVEQGHFSQLEAIVQPADNPAGLVVVTDFTFVVSPNDLYPHCDHFTAIDGRWTPEQARLFKEQIEEWKSGSNFSKRLMWHCVDDHRGGPWQL